MTIEAEVRAIVDDIVDECVRDRGGADEAVTALMRLMEPPETGVPIEAQVEIVHHAAMYMAGLWSGPAYVKNMNAALETLRWVQARSAK